jgi:mannose-6-phosphate isomerase
LYPSQTIDPGSVGATSRAGNFESLNMSHLFDWLRDAALPLWWEKGADRVVGGFCETLDDQAMAPRQNRRARVIGRQIYVYACAHRSGLAGPWREAAEHGLYFMTNHFIRPDGLIRATLDADGAPVGDQVALYDQAFCLFSLAAAASAGIDPEGCRIRAEALADKLEAQWRLPAGGFIEHDVQQYQANPHMHLFEASLEWEAAGGGARWTRLADEIAGMALTRFIDPQGGYLREFFDDQWRPAAGEAGRLVEPGHLFEWAWLMMRWAKLRGRDDVALAARKLHRVGVEHGVDQARGVAIDNMDIDLKVVSARARLWPQTERIKAAAILAQHAENAEDKAFYEAEVAAGAKGLDLYLQTPVRGLWRDKLNADGTFVQEPAPASSLYHIACAILDARARGYEI